MVKSVLWGASLDLGGSSLTGQLSSHLCGCPNPKVGSGDRDQSLHESKRYTEESKHETESQQAASNSILCGNSGKSGSCRSGMPSRLEWDFSARGSIPREQRPLSGPAGYEDGVEEHKIQSRQGSRLLYGQWWRGFESNKVTPLHPVASTPITAY